SRIGTPREEPPAVVGEGQGPDEPLVPAENLLLRGRLQIPEADGVVGTRLQNAFAVHFPSPRNGGAAVLRAEGHTEDRLGVSCLELRKGPARVHFGEPQRRSVTAGEYPTAVGGEVCHEERLGALAGKARQRGSCLSLPAVDQVAEAGTEHLVTV